MTAKLSLSIIIATRNNEHFIAEAITSVMSKMPTDCELIIVNDGSTDDSDRIIKEQIGDHPQVVYYPQQQSGVSVARNEGIRLSQGEYVAFIDGDDALHQDFYDAIMPKVRSQLFDIIAFKWTRNFNEFSKPTSNAASLAEKTDYHSIMKQTFEASYWQVWSRVFRKDLIAEDRFPVQLRYYEDVTFTPAQYLKSKSICVLDKTLYYYRVNRNSITENHCKEDVQDMFQALNSLITYTKAHNDKLDYIVPALVNCYIELRKKTRKMHGYYKYSESEIQIIENLNAVCKFKNIAKQHYKAFLKIKLYKLDIYVSKLKYRVLKKLRKH